MTEGRDEYENALRARRSASLRRLRTITSVVTAGLMTLMLVVGEILITRMAPGSSRFSLFTVAIVAGLWIAVAVRWARDRRKTDEEMLRRDSARDGRNTRIESWLRRHWRWAVPAAVALALGMRGASLLAIGGGALSLSWIATFGIAGMVTFQTALVGWRGWRTGDEEYCKQCGYPAPTGDELPICPECGKVLVKGVTTVRGRQERSPLMATIGSVAFAVLMVVGFLPGKNGVRAALASAMPTSTLISSAGGDASLPTTVVWTELSRRTLTSEEIHRLAAVILRNAENPAELWRVPGEASHWLGAMLGRGSLDDAAAKRVAALVVTRGVGHSTFSYHIRSGLYSAPPTQAGVQQVADAALAACMSGSLDEIYNIFEWVGRRSAALDLTAEWYDKAAETFVTTSSGERAANAWIGELKSGHASRESRGKALRLAARIVGATQGSHFRAREFLADGIMLGDAADEDVAVALADEGATWELLDAMSTGRRPAKPYPSLVRWLLQENERDRPGLGWSWLQGLRDAGEVSPEDAERFDRLDWRFRRIRGAPVR